MIMYILDTNILKEFSNDVEKRNKNVNKWMKSIVDSKFYITVFSVTETYKGIESLKKNKDPEKVNVALQLEGKMEAFFNQFGGLILHLDEKSAKEWGRRLSKHGTKNPMDLAIISIASSFNNAIVVTRNLADFRHRGIHVLNPFDDPPSEYQDPET